MSGNYFIGIDNGGTMVKAVIFDRAGNEISKTGRKVEMITPKPGYTERDMEYLYRVNGACIRQSLETSGLKNTDIAGISCTGHGKGLYMWGKNGKPAYNGIVSTDGRAWEYPLRWEEDGTANMAYKRTYQQVLASQPVSLLNWFEDHDPNVLQRVQWIFSVKDYIRFRLTGEAYGELTDFSGTNLVNLDTRNYDNELLGLFGLQDIRNCLPTLRTSNEQCGTITADAAALTGLAEGTPVSGGMFDIDACAIAMDVIDEDKLCVIAGTWSINEYVSKAPVKNKSVLMNSLFCIPEYYLVEECSPTSAGNYEWFFNMFLRDIIREAEEKSISKYDLAEMYAAEVHPEDASVIFLPYLFGSNYNPKSKAALVGMDSSTSRGQIIRAVMEGIAFCHMDHIDKLLKNRSAPSVVRLAGGAAKSDLWVQIFADVMNLPVEVIDTEELGALGCAMSAAVCTGAYKSLSEAAEHMVRVKKRVEPVSENVERYIEKRKMYQAAATSME